MQSHEYQDYYYEGGDEDSNVYAEPEFYVDQFYDQGPYGGSHEGMDEEGLAPFTLLELCEHCVQPTLHDGFQHVSKIFGWSLILRIVCQIPGLPDWAKHVASMVTGTLLAVTFFPNSVMYLLSLILISYFVLAVSEGFRGPVLAAFVISYNIGCESFLSDPVSWHQVRGAIMICSMKIISIGFDLDTASSNAQDKVAQNQDSTSASDDKKKPDKQQQQANNRKKRGGDTDKEEKVEEEAEVKLSGLTDCMPGWFQYAGYCVCPGTVILGPWVSYQQYNQIFVNSRWCSLRWCYRIIFSMVLAFFFLTVSTCWSQWFLPDSDWKWLMAYRDAMSFRTSHYFVSYISEATAISAGFGTIFQGEDDTNPSWKLEVTQPHRIEIPRSLVQVVVSWNLPMHAWLKKYVFKQARKSFGNGMAILATYCASTILHGLSAQLAAVLFSLGLYTWVEHNFRKKLAKLLNASIETKKEANGKYKYGESCAWVMVLNLVLSLLTVFHLAYLGVMFDQSESSNSGYSWHHTLLKWSKLGFRSHFVVFAMMFINFFL